MPEFSAQVERTFQSPTDIVWAALTRPEILSVWFTEGAEVDLRVGGRYANGDGDAGQYVEVEEERRLVMTWESPKHATGTLVTIDIASVSPGESHLRVVHSGLKTEDDLAKQAEGWSWAVDSLESFLKTGAGIPFKPWVELQTELRRRAQEKSAEEAEAERKAAGVVLHEIPQTTKTKRPRKAAKKEATKKKAVAKRAKKPSKPARRKKPASRPKGKKAPRRR